MKHLYVSELFSLLHDLGATQQAIADYLHVARSTVALWAAGHRPVPRRHTQPFLDYAATAIERACTDAWAKNVVPEQGGILGPRSSAEVSERKLLDGLERWQLERYATTGALDATYLRHGETVKRFLHLPPSKLNDEEKGIMQVALSGLKQGIRLQGHLRNRPDQTEGRQLWGPSGITPLERFWQIATWESAERTETTEEHG